MIKIKKKKKIFDMGWIVKWVVKIDKVDFWVVKYYIF